MQNLMEYLCNDGVFDAYTIVKLFVIILVFNLVASVIKAAMKGATV